MSSTDEAYLDERYGRTTTARARWAGRAGLGVLGLVALATALWVAYVFADQPVRWDTIGYRVDGPASTQVTFDVIMNPGTTATCRVQALSSSYAEVGVLDVAVGPADTRTSRYIETIPTAEEAVTALVDTCTVD